MQNRTSVLVLVNRFIGYVWTEIYEVGAMRLIVSSTAFICIDIFIDIFMNIFINIGIDICIDIRTGIGI